MTQGVNNREIFDEITMNHLDNCVSIIISTNLILIYNVGVTRGVGGWLCFNHFHFISFDL